MEKKVDVNEFVKWMDASLKGETYTPQQEIPQYVTVTYGGGYCLPEEEDWYTAQICSPESNYYYTSSQEETYVPRTEYYEDYPDLAATVVGYVPESTPSSTREETYVPRAKYDEDYPDIVKMLIGDVSLSTPSPPYVQQEPSYSTLDEEEETTTTEDNVFERFKRGEANILDIIKYFQRGGKPPNNKEEEERFEIEDYYTPEEVSPPVYAPSYSPPSEISESIVTYGKGICYPEEEEYYKSLQRKRLDKFNILPLLIIIVLFYFLYKKLKKR